MDDERWAETRRVQDLHRLLAVELDAASGRRTAALATRPGGELSARWERDVAVHRWSERAAQLRAARAGLCFGRLDATDPAAAPVYVGRIGLTDDGETALVDWRAPAAQPFYCATLATPMGLARRRRFVIAGIAPEEWVADLHDDLFVAERGDAVDAAADPALQAALTAPRGTQMRDIVATIQAEQDAVIRLPLSGTVVIEGGPGTGKTAVALHRVAYLMYTHREQLERRGVLVVGPSAAFVSYVGDVLPSLGESAVVFTTPGRLRHGLDVTALDEPEVARLKGDLGMCDVLRRAVVDLASTPEAPVPIALDAVTLLADRAAVATARDRARDSGLRHNAAQVVFAEALMDLLVERGVEEITGGVLADPVDLPESWDDGYAADPAESAATIAADLADDLRGELLDHPGFRAVVGRFWPRRTPERVLADLLSTPELLASAGADPRLHRADGEAWTVSDTPLLDELAELLGPLREPNRRRRPDPARYAADVLAIIESHDRSLAGEDPDEVRASDFVTAGMLAERFEEGLVGSVAERAAADREWTYGHLVVDEAQELSPMDWHVLARRCPTRSITAVGDRAQRSAAAGARTWEEVLSPVAGDRWNYRTLTVNYRTPAEIMAEAALALPEAERYRVPRSVRATGVPPLHRTAGAAGLPTEVAATVAEELAAAAGTGTLAVIAADGVELPALPAGVKRHTPLTAKGLEFDVVVLADPEAITEPADRYVAMTRATQRLVLVHAS